MSSTAVPARSSDEAVFLEMLLPLLPQAHRLAYGMLQSAVDAEDAVQESALQSWRARGRFRRDREMRPWFLAIVANECRQRRRSRWWSVRKVAAVPEAASPEASLSWAADDLRSALDRLTADARLVLVLRYYLDLAFDDIGRILRCSPKAAKSRTHRALVRLRIEVPEELRHG